VVKADPATFKASVPKIYTAGDYMTGPSTVIECISAGRKAAERIARDLTGNTFREWFVKIEETTVTDRAREWDHIPRKEMPKVEPPEQRFNPVNREVETGFSVQEADEESKRCYLCYLHYEIDIDRCIYCRYCIDAAPRDCIKLVEDIVLDESGGIAGLVETSDWRKVGAVVIDNARCIRCGACLRVCPVDCISVSKVQLTERLLPAGE
jgi:glutamate synthase (NADPH) small chain